MLLQLSPKTVNSLCKEVTLKFPIYTALFFCEGDGNCHAMDTHGMPITITSDCIQIFSFPLWL